MQSVKGLLVYIYNRVIGKTGMKMVMEKSWNMTNMERSCGIL